MYTGRMNFAGLVVVLAQPVMAPHLTEVEQKQLQSGTVLTREVTPTGNRGVGAMAIGLVDAPTDEVWPILRDCQHFWQFMPRTKKSWVREEEGVGRICHVELVLPFPLPQLWSDTVSVTREEPAQHYVRSWSMVRGNYRRNDGAWVLVPTEGGSKSIVVYSIDSDPIMAVPDALIRLGQASTLPEVIVQIRKRVQSLRSAAVKR